MINNLIAKPLWMPTTPKDNQNIDQLNEKWKYIAMNEKEGWLEWQRRDSHHTKHDLRFIFSFKDESVYNYVYDD